MALEPTLDGNFKNVYSGKIENLIPEEMQIQKEISFSQPSDRIGLQYNQPVILSDEAGAELVGPTLHQ